MLVPVRVTRAEIKIGWSAECRRLLWFGRKAPSASATIISYQRFNQLGVDVVDAFEAFQPRSLLAYQQPRRMCKLTIG